MAISTSDPTTTTTTMITIRSSWKPDPPTTSIAPVGQEKISGDCKSPLGFENGKIKDTQLSASSYYHLFYIKRKNVDMKAKFARLNGELAWCCTKSQQCHLTVDLGHVTNISGIATQGIDGVGHYYVKTYKIKFGTDGAHWNQFSENGPEKEQEKVWQGNQDGSTIAQNTFPHVLQARFLQIHPLTYNLYSCLRMELYGCISKCKSKSIGGNGTQTTASPKSNTTRRMGRYNEIKRGMSTPLTMKAVVIGSTVLSVTVLLLIAAVVALYVWRHHHVRRHARDSPQIYLTEVAVEPDCGDIMGMGSHVTEHLVFTNNQHCKDEDVEHGM